MFSFQTLIQKLQNVIVHYGFRQSILLDDGEGEDEDSEGDNGDGDCDCFYFVVSAMCIMISFFSCFCTSCWESKVEV